MPSVDRSADLRKARLGIRPVANPVNVLTGANYRITVVDPGLVRLEYSEKGRFEDRASQMAIDRAFPLVEFGVIETADLLVVETVRMRLTYDKGPFTTSGLSVKAKGGRHSRGVWRYGLPTRNLGGTACTLDDVDVDGACRLEPGILSREGVTVVGDSNTVLLDNGWIAPRHSGNLDVYVFAFGRDYKRALRAFYRLRRPDTAASAVRARQLVEPLPSILRLGVPAAARPLRRRRRSSLGGCARHGLALRRHRSEVRQRLDGLHLEPRTVPGSAGVPAGIARARAGGLAQRAPAEGVHAHEQAYPAIAKRLGIDPGSELPVSFDPIDPDFLQAYFGELHHPLEDQGVDFWWLDWQQGAVTRVPGLDPLGCSTTSTSSTPAVGAAARSRSPATPGSAATGIRSAFPATL